MLTSEDILDRLGKMDVSRKEIAAVMGVDPARVTELRKGDRRLLHDEAVKLVEAFGLEPDHVPVDDEISLQLAKLQAAHVALSVGAQLHPDSAEAEEIAKDLVALAKLAASPVGRDTFRQVGSMFEGMMAQRQLLDQKASA